MKSDLLISLILFIIFVPTDSVSSDDIQSIDSLILDLPTIRVATDDFADTKMIGQGGFGMVYKVENSYHMYLYQLYFCRLYSKYLYLDRESYLMAKK